MDTRTDNKSTWYREPMVWLIVVLPAMAIAGSLITAWLAARDPDPLVSEGFAKEGLTITQDTARAQQADSLDMQAHLQTEGSRLTLRLSGNLHPYPAELQVRLPHPTQASDDVVLVAHTTGVGTYATMLPAMRPGKRQVILEAADGTWRLSGYWTAPFNGSIQLGGTSSPDITPAPH